MSALIGALRVTLGLDSAAFEQGLTKAQVRSKKLADQMGSLSDRVGAMGKAMAAAGAAVVGGQVFTQMRAMAHEGLEYAGSLGEQAQQLGVTTSALQQYRYIASQVGIEQETMEKGLVKLTGKLGDLAVGASGAENPFGRLKLSQEEYNRLSKMTAEEALPLLADKFAALGSDTERVAAAQELFGEKMGGKFIGLLAEGSAGINQLTAAYKKLGIELSPEEIAKADDALDKLSALQQATLAQKARIATDNSKLILESEAAWEQFKVKALQFSADIENAVTAFDEFNASEAAKARATFAALGHGAQEAGQRIVKFVQNTMTGIREMAQGVGKWFSTMYQTSIDSVAKLVNGVQQWLQGKLTAVIKWVADKLGLLGDAFFKLYDRVVGHSYVPDLVDGIADHFARLDGVMVKPAERAAAQTAATFKKLQADLDPLMRRLFPEAAAQADLARDRAILNAAAGRSKYSEEQLAEAQRRLSLEGYDKSTVLQDFLAGTDDPLALTENLQEQLRKLSGAANDNADQMTAANVRVVKSFKDMASETLDALQTLTSAIKGGDFLDILTAVVGFGVKLGSAGVFGSGVQSKLNSPIPGFALGTPAAPRGLAWVGERGPELVNFRGGERVWPSGSGPRGMGGGNVYHFSGNLMTPEFWARIQAGDAMAAQAGARGGVGLMGRKMSRRLA